MDQVETTARAMCRADGHDPDLPVPEALGRAPDEGAASAEPVPRWRAYEPQARKLVALQAALLAGG